MESRWTLTRGNGHRCGFDSDDEQRAVNAEARDELLEGLGAGRGAHYDLRASQSLERLRLVDLRPVDVLVRAVDEIWQGQSTVSLERGDHCTRICVTTRASEPYDAVSLTVV